jgi:ATP-dependent DNA helicase RecQ
MVEPKQILQKYWGFSSFREPQEAIIATVLKNKDCIALLPTGGGKSICFQVPALAKKGVCLVISPLIALMQDQISQLKQRGIKAETIVSKATEDDIINLFDKIKFSNVKFLYISPERLQSKLIQQKLQELELNIIAVDEAHCISEWGHDFRPAYRNIKSIKVFFTEVPIIALTATANKKVIKDIAENLHLDSPKVFQKSFFKENLAYHILNTENKQDKLIQIFTKFKKPAIVYVNRRKNAYEIATLLNSNNFKASFYHAGLQKEEKETAFKNWMNETTPIMVATNAFGMGIDKSNIGLVVHYNLPSSTENYVQESGRAGRNTEKAFAILLKNENDILLFKEQINKNLPSLQDIKTIHKKLYQHFQISLGEVQEDFFNFNLLEFCEKYQFSVAIVENVLAILKNHQIIELEKNYKKKSTVQCITNSRIMLNYTKSNLEIHQFATTLLRTYSGLFDNEVTINEFFLAKKAGITSQKVIQFLKQLHKNNSIVYKHSSSPAIIKFLVPREDDKTINKIAKEIKQFILQKKEKADRFLKLINNNTVCRSIQILNYFEEKNAKKCGVCDVCQKQLKSGNKSSTSEITSLLRKHNTLSSFEISNYLSIDEKYILIHLRTLLADDKIAVNHQNKYLLK